MTAPAISTTAGTDKQLAKARPCPLLSVPRDVTADSRRTWWRGLAHEPERGRGPVGRRWLKSAYATPSADQSRAAIQAGDQASQTDCDIAREFVQSHGQSALLGRAPTKSIFMITVVDHVSPWLIPSDALAAIIDDQLGAQRISNGTGIATSQPNSSVGRRVRRSAIHPAARFAECLRQAVMSR